MDFVILWQMANGSPPVVSGSSDFVLLALQERGLLARSCCLLLLQALPPSVHRKFPAQAGTFENVSSSRPDLYYSSC